MTPTVTVVIPAKNEAEGLAEILPRIKTAYPEYEIVVVDDGSTDETASVARAHGARVVSHPLAKGNGAAIKSGARAAKGEILLFMDADGQHQPEDVGKLLDFLAEGFDMVVGARTRESQAGVHRAAANRFYNYLASWMVGH
ncbi:MAG TPA: glycosyltransferase family 2 protein, partial [Nitrosomonas sp.]|nr:glycosyltransferase family 2 protein [Nitrosomonas sp.]